MTQHVQIATESGVEVDVPLNKRKQSPKNARKVPHTQAAIEALAASIGAKRMLYPLLVEPEFKPDSAPTGYYLVTIGEGRRLAQRLRAKRGEIKKTHPIGFAEIDAALEAFGDGTAFDPDEIARGGVFVILGQDGVARVERGLIRPEDIAASEPEAEPEGEEARGDASGEGEEVASGKADEDAGAPLSERLVLDVTSHRTWPFATP